MRPQEHLDLGWNRLGSRGAIQLFVGAAQAQALLSLSLPFNSLTDGAGTTLAGLLARKESRCVCVFS